MTRTFYRVEHDTNFGVQSWIYEEGDPFGFVHQLHPGYLVVTPLPWGQRGFPPPPRVRPICTVDTVGPDGITATPDVPPSDFRIAGDYWIVSDRLKRLLEHFDPEAFSFVEIEMRWQGWGEGRTAWLARIVRSFETRDAADIPRSVHAFLRSNNAALAYFDDDFRAHALAEGMTGLRFEAVTKL